MENTFYKKRNLKAFLLVAGVLLLLSGCIRIHFAIARAITLGELTNFSTYFSPSIDIITTYSYIEHAFSISFLLLGFVALIIILNLIGNVFENEKSQSLTSIILLVIFIGFEIFREVYSEILEWTNEWVGVGLLFLYGLYRGLALSQVNKQLNVPEIKYGKGFFSFYAWSFLFTMFLSLIITVVATSVDDFTIVMYAQLAGLWVEQNQVFMDVVAIIAIGSKLVIDGTRNPIIQSRVQPRTAPDIDTRVELGMGQYKRLGVKRPKILDEYPLEDDFSEPFSDDKIEKESEDNSKSS